MQPKPAPPWQTTTWLNIDAPLTLEDLRGRVVVLHAFQILCRGCVEDAVPQMKRVFEAFRDAPLTVVGLHTVFENHAAQSDDALREFVRTHDLRFPIGVDAPGPDGDPLPRTMRAYDMLGTPTLVLIDGQGRRRRQVFGHVPDLLLGADLGVLLAEIARS
jgi:peroxiredoxin